MVCKDSKSESFILIHVALILVTFWDMFDYLMPNLSFVILFFLTLILLYIKKNIFVTKNFAFISLFVLLHGTINIILENNTLELFLKQYLNVYTNILFFWLVVRDNRIDKIYSIYLKYALFISEFAILEEFACLFGISSYIPVPFFKEYDKVLIFSRVSAFCYEPSFLGYYLCPAVCIAVFYVICKENLPNILNKTMSTARAWIIITAMLFTFSLTGYIGLFVSILLAIRTKKIGSTKILLPLMTLFLCVFAYNELPAIQMRVDNTLAIFLTDIDYSSINISSYTYFANFNVTLKSIEESWFIGYGLASYPIAYDRYNVGGWGEADLMLNRTDGNSMLFRILTELGVFGFIMISVYMIRYYINNNKINYIYTAASLALFLILLMRQGHYTHGGVMLFALLYHKNYIEEIKKGEYSK